MAPDVSEDRGSGVRAAFDAHARATEVDVGELLSRLREAVDGDPSALAWVRARERDYSAAARAFREIERAAERADLISVADAAPVIGVDLVTLMRRIETRGLAYALPPGGQQPRGRLYIRRDDLERLR